MAGCKLCSHFNCLLSFRCGCLSTTAVYINAQRNILLQAFAKRKLDNDGDGKVNVRDVFAFLQNTWNRKQQVFHSRKIRASRSSCPHTLDYVHEGLNR